MIRKVFCAVYLISMLVIAKRLGEAWYPIFDKGSPYSFFYSKYFFIYVTALGVCHVLVTNFLLSTLRRWTCLALSSEQGGDWLLGRDFLVGAIIVQFCFSADVVSGISAFFLFFLPTAGVMTYTLLRARATPSCPKRRSKEKGEIRPPVEKWMRAAIRLYILLGIVLVFICMVTATLLIKSPESRQIASIPFFAAGLFGLVYQLRRQNKEQSHRTIKTAFFTALLIYGCHHLMLGVVCKPNVVTQKKLSSVSSVSAEVEKAIPFTSI